MADDENEDQEALVDRLFELVLNARATDAERDELLTFILETRKRLTAGSDEDADLRAWAMACHALFASSRFQILD